MIAKLLEMGVEVRDRETEELSLLNYTQKLGSCKENLLHLDFQ